MTTLLDTQQGEGVPNPIDDGFTLDFPGMVPGTDYTIKLVLADVRTRAHRDTLFSVDANRQTALRHGAIVNSVDPVDGMVRASFISPADPAGAIRLTFSSAFDRRQIRGVEILKGRHTPPSAPASVVALIGVGRVIVRWDPVEGATSYIVRRRGGHTHHMAPIASGLTDCRFDDLMVAPDVTYSYQVIPVGGLGEGAPSLTVDAVPAISLQAQPATVALQRGVGSCLIAAALQPDVEGTLTFAIGGLRDGLQAVLEPESITVTAEDALRGSVVTCLKLVASSHTGPGVQNLMVRARVDQFSDALSIPVRIV